MANFFGTDGIRGEYGKNLTPDIAIAVGNALAQTKAKPKIVIGHDTRLSADVLTLAISTGILQGGGDVFNVGTIPTAGISFLTKSQNFDFGIIITASHNPPNHNGIKIFDSTGKKLSDSEEECLEKLFASRRTSQQCGRFFECPHLQRQYLNHLLACTSVDLSNFVICVDASNGASCKIAPKVFEKLGAKVVKTACASNWAKINTNCGSLHIQNLKNKVLQAQADIGFAFDGDADRVIAVSQSGEIFDGDKILYVLANYMKANNQLFANTVVGTSHTNSGIMIGLNRNKINLLRTDIGDKYVIEAMEKMNLTLGGEQSGHIIIKNYAQTGDGILTALKVCEAIKKTGKSLDKLFDAMIIPQININLPVKDKIKVLNNEKLNNLTTQILSEIAPAGRILVRASGTEEKVRIMIEYPNIHDAENYANQIKTLIEKI